MNNEQAQQSFISVSVGYIFLSHPNTHDILLYYSGITNNNDQEKVSEYDEEIPLRHTADQPVVL